MTTEVLIGILALLAASAAQPEARRPAPAAPIVLTASRTTEVSPARVDAADQAPQLVPVSGWKSRTATVASLPATPTSTRPARRPALTPTSSVAPTVASVPVAANQTPFPAVTQQMPVLPTSPTVAYQAAVPATAAGCAPAATPQVTYVPQQVTFVPRQVTYAPQQAGYVTQAPVAALRPVVGPTTFVPAVSTGLYGQPTLYVPGQPLRNFLRYLSP